MIERLCHHAWSWQCTSPLPPHLSEAEQEAHKKAWRCYACKKPFKFGVRKRVLDHDHDSGKYRGAACNNCNLKMRRPTTMVVYMRNFEGYDCSHILTAAANLLALPKYSKLRHDAILATRSASLRSASALSDSWTPATSTRPRWRR